MPRFEYAIDALSYEISKGDSEFSNQEHRRNELKRLETLEVEDFDSWNSH